MSENREIEELAASAMDNQAEFDELVEQLSGPSRRRRQRASAVIGVVARKDPEKAKSATAALIDALNRPEAQTRWESLEALTCLVAVDARSCEKALPGAEASLFDEDSGLAHLAAMRFLCKYGATTENRASKTWPLIDEGLQCYHGDTEFQDMLIAVIDYAKGKLPADVKEELAKRVAFDANNGKGVLKTRASQIVANLE